MSEESTTAGWGERRFRAEVDRLAYVADPAAAVARHEKAVSERHTSIRPVADGMVRLSALLPLAKGVSVHATLSRCADSARAAGDERTRGQVMADTLVEAVLGDADVVPVTVQVTLSDAALLNLPGRDGDEPGWVGAPGTGAIPLPADLVRDLVRRASEQGVAELKRLYLDRSGRLVAMESTARTFPAGLADLLTTLPHPQLRRTGAPPRPRPAARRGRPHERGQRAGPLRRLQLRQAGPRMVVATTARRPDRHRDHHPQRLPPPQPRAGPAAPAATPPPPRPRLRPARAGGVSHRARRPTPRDLVRTGRSSEDRATPALWSPVTAPAPEDVTFDVVQHPDRTVVVVSGELDVLTVPHLRRVLYDPAQVSTPSVVVDLAAVSFLDSVGIGALVAARRWLTSRGATMSLACADNQPRKVLRMMGLDKVFEIVAPEVG